MEMRGEYDACVAAPIHATKTGFSLQWQAPDPGLRTTKHRSFCIFLLRSEFGNLELHQFHIRPNHGNESIMASCEALLLHQQILGKSSSAQSKWKMEDLSSAKPVVITGAGDFITFVQKASEESISHER